MIDYLFQYLTNRLQIYHRVLVLAHWSRQVQNYHHPVIGKVEVRHQFLSGMHEKIIQLVLIID